MAESTPYRPRCMHLSCKAMLVYGESFEDDPDYQAGTAEFWCNLTSKLQGPDGADAALAACSKPDRSCFQEY